MSFFKPVCRHISLPANLAVRTVYTDNRELPVLPVTGRQENRITDYDRRAVTRFHWHVPELIPAGTEFSGRSRASRDARRVGASKLRPVGAGRAGKRDKNTYSANQATRQGVLAPFHRFNPSLRNAAGTPCPTEVHSLPAPPPRHQSAGERGSGKMLTKVRGAKVPAPTHRGSLSRGPIAPAAAHRGPLPRGSVIQAPSHG